MTTSPRTGVAAESTAGDYVARLLPPTAEAPEPRRRISFLKAVLLFWLLPRRYGPHLAVASMGRAVAAHVVSLLLAAFILGVSSLADLQDDWTGFRGLRVALASFVLEAAAASAGSTWSWLMALAVIGFLPLVQVFIVLLGGAAMPWAAGGDRASSVWKRSVKNAYWSTTILITIAVYAVAVRLGAKHPIFEGLREGTAIFIGILVAGIGALLFVAWLRMLLAGAHRCVGPADGPAFAPREPHCDDCGYLIVGLPLENNCPECGLPVGESLPGGRRQPTKWQQHELRERGVIELFRLHWDVLVRGGLFHRIPVHEGMSAARHFWWATYAILVLAALGIVQVFALLAPADSAYAFAMGSVSTLAVPLPFALQSGTMFLACLWAQSRLDIKDYRVSAIACYYASPLLWPVMLVSCGLLLIHLPPVYAALQTTVIIQGSAGRSIDGVAAAHVVWALLLLISYWFWRFRLMAALQAVRYANY